MSKVVVLSETNCIGYLRAHGFYPAEFYTDLELFKSRSIFFNDVIVVLIYAGTCIFPKRKMEEVRVLLEDRVKIKESGIVDLIVISNTVLPYCDDYLRYEDTPMECIRYSGERKTSGIFHIRTLDYEQASTTITFLANQDYGFAPEALKNVRIENEEERKLKSLIKVPNFE